MPRRSVLIAFVILWWTLGVFLLVASVQTVIYSRGAGRPSDIHGLVIGSIEALAAVLFLIPRTLRIGGVGLLVTIAIALLIHAARGQFPAILLVYAAGVFFVTVHGRVSFR